MNIVENIILIATAIIMTVVAMFVVVSVTGFIVDEIKTRIKEKKNESTK